MLNNKNNKKKMNKLRGILVPFMFILFLISPSLPAIAISDLYGVITGGQVTAKKLVNDTKDDEKADNTGNDLTIEDGEESLEIHLKHLLPYEFKFVASLKMGFNKINNLHFIDVFNTSSFLTQRLLL